MLPFESFDLIKKNIPLKNIKKEENIKCGLLSKILTSINTPINKEITTNNIPVFFIILYIKKVPSGTFLIKFIF